MNPNHSPSRERVERYAGRLRRYFLDNPLERRKVFYTLLAVCSATILLGIFALTRSDRPYSHGPVAGVHTSFDANCEACHKPQSIGSVGVSAFNPQSRWLDLECQTCHGGPDHHRDAKWPTDWPSQEINGKPTDAQCAACHHDHNGKDFSLVRLDDAHCTKCHADLANYHKAGSSQFVMKVKNFYDPAGGHPEFKKLDAEKQKPHERGLKFSHAHHMTEGVGYLAAGRGKMTKKDLVALNKDDPTAASRYFGKDAAADAAVQLRCSSCHQLDAGRMNLDGKSSLVASLAGDPKASILPPRAEGAYYLPINYEAHCQTCHPLKSPALTSDAGQEFPAFDLPHRKQPKEMKEVLRARYSGYLLSEKGKLDLLNKNAGDEETLKVGQQLEQAVNKSLGKLFASVNPNAKNAISGGTCTECHMTAGNDPNVEKVTVVSPAIPTVWFEHSKFNHISHRSYSCIDCHPNTAPAPQGKATFDAAKIYTGDDQKINILGVESCRVCHTPNTTRDVHGVGMGGVRSNCTDCHRYHNGDNPFQGRGAELRDPPKK
ncbi:cytochrome c3 family protein [Limnoglobus roseus]|uniref:Uncharacterized protein n=1 Tax=Limnoglobus roseus TaxID=2598579 RepID=A0A5C1ACD2_9BACT|nr:cytochrome c3 family protein [Limnoglobus roseus]QEL16951.1 hypothetical protein PX52LOC_03927 [Limnoglobus roseus]